MPAPATSFLFTVCQLGAEDAVKRELGDWRLAFSRPGFLTFKRPGVVVGEDVRIDAVFVRAYGASIGVAKDAGEVIAIASRFLPPGEPLRLHAFERDLARPGDEPADFEYGVQARDVATAIARAWNLTDRPLLVDDAPPAQGQRVLDVVIARGEPLWVGMHRHGGNHSPWPGGRMPAVSIADVPSRAYRKLEEALIFSRAPLRPGDVAVELGSAPGGASLALLRRGVNVFGVDPGQMDRRVLDFAGPSGNRFVHLNTTMGDVDRSELPRALHWIVMDVNAAPQVALKTVQRLAGAPSESLMGVLLTLKLDDWKATRHVPKLLARIRDVGMANLRATQLPSNRMEWFACGLTATGLKRLNRLPPLDDVG